MDCLLGGGSKGSVTETGQGCMFPRPSDTYFEFPHVSEKTKTKR